MPLTVTDPSFRRSERRRPLPRRINEVESYGGIDDVGTQEEVDQGAHSSLSDDDGGDDDETALDGQETVETCAGQEGLGRSVVSEAEGSLALMMPPPPSWFAVDDDQNSCRDCSGGVGCQGTAKAAAAANAASKSSPGSIGNVAAPDVADVGDVGVEYNGGDGGDGGDERRRGQRDCHDDDDSQGYTYGYGEVDHGFLPPEVDAGNSSRVRVDDDEDGHGAKESPSPVELGGARARRKNRRTGAAQSNKHTGDAPDGAASMISSKNTTSLAADYATTSTTTSTIYSTATTTFATTFASAQTATSTAARHLSTTLPKAAHELITSTLRRAVHTTRIAYVSRTWVGRYRRHTDLGSNVGGWYINRDTVSLGFDEEQEEEDLEDEVSTDGGSRSVDGEAEGEGGTLWSSSSNSNKEKKLRRRRRKQMVIQARRRRLEQELSLPPFSSLPWVDRQLVKEWRTCDHTFTEMRGRGASLLSSSPANDVVNAGRVGGARRGDIDEAAAGNNNAVDHDDDDLCPDLDSIYLAARTLVPQPHPRPPRENSTTCYSCRTPFGPTTLRHHCRLCGRSYCHLHSSQTHRLPHLGYDPDVPERVCHACKSVLEERNLAERVAWRTARIRDFLGGDLVPYFETGVDTVEDAAIRLTRAAIELARRIPLGAQATVAVETLEVLRKHGLKGVYGLILRKEFMAAADLLCRVAGINKRAWPLSVHELSAAIFYALARHRMMRGMDPEREHRIHAFAMAEEDDGDCGGGFGSKVTERADEDATVDAPAADASGGTVVHAAATAYADPAAERTEAPAAVDLDGGSSPSPPPSWKEILGVPHGTEIFSAVQQEEDEGDKADDTIAWGAWTAAGGPNGLRSSNCGIEQGSSSSNAVLDEADAFDPLTESVANLIPVADGADPTDIAASRRGGEGGGGNDGGDDDARWTTPSTQDHEGGSYTEDIPVPVLPASATLAVVPENDGVIDGHRAADDDADACSMHPPRSQQRRPSQTRSAGGLSRPLAPVCTPVSDGLISSLIFYAPLALNFIYAPSEVDMQLLAAQQGWRLLYAHLDQNDGLGYGSASTSAMGGHVSAGDGDTVADRPASALFVRADQKIACLAVRGTATINDVVTDIRATPVPFPPEEEEEEGDDDDVESSAPSPRDNDGWTPVSRGQGLALCGMARAAVNLFQENVDSLSLLAERGYRIRIVGHSLGGGVAALLGSLIRRHLERSLADGDNVSGVDERDDALRVYGYGSPACVDAKLADYAQSYVTNCVLHDDVVPRLTPTSIRGLLKHLLHIRETWVKDHLTDDITAYADRARSVWAPRWRQSFTLLRSTSRRKSVKYKEKPAGESLGGSRRLQAETKTEVGGASLESTGGEDYRSPQLAVIESMQEGARTGPANNDNDNEGESFGADTIDSQQENAIDIDGDLFYEAEENLIESDDEGCSGTPRRTVRKDEWSPFDEPPMANFDANANGGGGSKDETTKKKVADEKDNKRSCSPPAVMVEETPLPRMFIPGQIVHIYTHRGAYKAACVPRAFRELRRVSLAGNMLSDHMSKQYYESLLEVKSVRRAEQPLPEWTGFGEESTCSCCASHFTWASTSSSEAQEARDKHNCRSCGSLVCDPCSRNRLPLPPLGMVTPERVCDRCYNDMGGVMTEGDVGYALTRSFIENIDEREGGKHNLCNVILRTNGDNGGRSGDSAFSSLARASGDDAEIGPGIERKSAAARIRQRRNLVVDELASRIPSLSAN